MDNGNVRVLHSTNKGVTWSDMTGNLPDIPALQVEYHPASDRLFVGTDVGLFEYNQSSGDWEKHTNFPIVPITRMIINEPYQDLTVATYGRGLWRTNLSCHTDNELTISSNQLWEDSREICENILVTNNATLAVTNSLKMPPLSTITVDPGAKIIFQGGLEMGAGSKIILEDGAKLNVIGQNITIEELCALETKGNAEITVYNASLINNGEFICETNGLITIKGNGKADIATNQTTLPNLYLKGLNGNLTVKFHENPQPDKQR